MSENYTPEPGVEPKDTFATALLSQRDLGLSIPINFVTRPGVSLSAACFSQNVYEDDASADCLSNLIALGFRRFVLDLYWDQERALWSFCPVAIPSIIPTSGFPSSTTIDGSSALRSATSSITTNSTQSTGINARQVTSVNGTSTALPTAASETGTTLGDEIPTVTSLPEAADVPTIKIGPYACSTTMNLSVFTTQIFDYIRKTETTISASLVYVILNVHAAATFGSPSGPAPQPTSLPSTEKRLATLFSNDLSAYLYKADELRNDRLNLNGSWYITNERYRPVNGYYTTTSNSDGIISTEDGWPAESYIEFQKSQSVLLGWGTIDPQMSGYDISADADIIFDAGFIADPQRDVAANSNGNITNGCFVRTGDRDVAQANNSWAVSYAVPGFQYPTSSEADLRPLLDLTKNITSCGISPILNYTLLSKTADQDHIPYLNYSASTIWSWEPNQPSASNTSARSDDNPNSLHRCATTSSITGRWSVSDCSSRFPAACRSRQNPYNWTLSSNSIAYSSASSSCDDKNGYQFAVPRTALENAYLTQRIREMEGQGRERARVWLDFNSLNAEGCWVSGGVGGLCPYSRGQGFDDDLQKRTILVPTIAAIIVLIISALTVFVKVAGNRKTRRRTRRRKKRAENGFVYEGVPS